MSTMTSAMVFLRPMRSPSGPKMNPPSGRIKNDNAKVAKEDSSAMAGVAAEKKAWPT